MRFRYATIADIYCILSSVVEEFTLGPHCTTVYGAMTSTPGLAIVHKLKNEHVYLG